MRCDVHTALVHVPAPLEWDRHHLIPRAWQAAWRPSSLPAVAAALGLWDSHRINVPATCHRNVHVRIVQIMKVLAQRHAVPTPAGVHHERPGAAGPALLTSADVHAAVEQVSAEFNIGSGTPEESELQAATLSPLRWLEAGGDLRFLLDHKMWGEA